MYSINYESITLKCDQICTNMIVLSLPQSFEYSVTNLTLALETSYFLLVDMYGEVSKYPMEVTKPNIW
jgi:hypothetical protein